MNKLHRKQWILTAAAVIVFASASLAQTTTSITLTGVGDGSVVTNPTYFGVYVDPYTATVGGTSNVSVICDDWSDNSYVPETWTAYVNTVAAATNGTATPSPLFGNGTTTYEELAWLGTQLLANPTNQTVQAEISFAIWELTYGVNGTKQEVPDPTTFLAGAANGSTYQSAISGANGLLAQAAAAVTAGYKGAGWEILTPDTGASISSPGSSTNPPQEFLVYTPESSSGILLAADMFGLLGLAIVFRRRLLRPIA